jgi:hypothetical protein
MNEACIFKLGWKLQSSSQDFWCEVMCGKYKMNDRSCDVVAKPYDSSLWNNIVKLWHDLPNYNFWSAGDGK